MLVMILPVEGQISTAAVWVDGAVAGHIEQVRPASSWEDYRGDARVGLRWLPEGLPADLPGPASPADAALLLLALEGYDREAALASLHRGGRSTTLTI